MPSELHITAHCVISQQVIRKNGVPVFRAEEGDDLPAFLVGAYRHLNVNYPKYHKMDNLSKLGWLAVEFLLKDSFVPGQYAPKDIGVVLANASSSLDTDIRYFETTQSIASPALFVYTLPNIVMGEICIRHHFKGENAFFVQPGFDPVFLRQYVGNLMNNNILQCCICGWVEILATEYKTVLFLTEKTGKGAPDTAFTAENINKTYQLANGNG